MSHLKTPPHTNLSPLMNILHPTCCRGCSILSGTLVLDGIRQMNIWPAWCARWLLWVGGAVLFGAAPFTLTGDSKQDGGKED